MDKVFHPVSGEKGYFCSEKEKRIIDVALEFLSTQFKDAPLRSSECGVMNG